MWPSGLSARFFFRTLRTCHISNVALQLRRRTTPRLFLQSTKTFVTIIKDFHPSSKATPHVGVSTQHAVENWGGKKKKKTFWEDGVKSIINIPQIWKWSCDSSDNYILSFGSSQRHYVPSSCWLSKMTSRQNDLPLLFWSIRQVFLLSGLFSNFRMVWVHFRAVLLLLMMLINIPARQNWRLFKRS